MNCPYSTKLTRSAYNTIEAESFNYLKGVSVEACPEGTSNLGGMTGGLQTYTRTVLNPGNQNDCGNLIKTESCQKDCSIHCDVAYTNWSNDCSATCGINLKKSRTFS